MHARWGAQHGWGEDVGLGMCSFGFEGPNFWRSHRSAPSFAFQNSYWRAESSASMASLTFGGLGLSNWPFPSHKASLSGLLSPPCKASSRGLGAQCLRSASFSLGSVFSSSSEDQEFLVPRMTAAMSLLPLMNAVPSWVFSHIK